MFVEAWCENLPDGWTSAEVKFLFDIQLGKMLQPEQKLSTEQLTKYLKAQHVQWDFVAIEDLPEMWSSPRDMNQYRVRNGDLLVCEGGEVGRSAILQNLEEEAIIQNALHRVRSSKNDVRFLNYVLRTVHSAGWFEVICNRATIAHFTREKFGALRIPKPPVKTQEKIATFLDRKTAAIDTLIAKKQRLIELLEEKRAALINQAVTKGLNPNVPMKDSGIPWIGEIPEHWEITKLKWLSPFITVGIVITPSKYYVDEGIPCLRSLNIKPGEILAKNLVYISEESNNLLAKSNIFKGDLVCVRTGQPGTTAVVDERFENANCIDLILIRKTKKASSEFLCLQMNSEVCRSQYTVGTSGAIQQHFNVETAQNLILCDPPLDEQAEIVSHCQKIIEKHNLLIQKAFVQIEKLQEYRQSLITAAVTGKLEVPVDEAA